MKAANNKCGQRMCEEKVNVARLTWQYKVVVCRTVYDLYLFKIRLFFLCCLNGRVIICEASFLKHTGQIGNQVEKKIICRTCKVCQYVDLSFLICPQAV